MNVASVAGWRESYYVARIDRDGRIIKILSDFFESRKAAERFYAWRRQLPGVVLVQRVEFNRVLD